LKTKILTKIDQNIPLSKKVEEQLREAIIQKVYTPGEKLPSENELVNIFGVSRTAIREAMRTLAGQGLVDVNGRNGAYVTEIDISSVVNPFTLLLRRKSGEASHFYLKQARRILEPEIARLAAQKRTEMDIEYLTEAFESMKKYCNIHDKMIDYDTRFHRRMALSTGNPIIPIIMEPIFSLLPEFISENFKLSHAQDKAIEEHARLLNCMIRKADDECYDAMTTHMITAENHVLEYYKRMGFKEF